MACTQCSPTQILATTRDSSVSGCLAFIEISPNTARNVFRWSSKIREEPPEIPYEQVMESEEGVKEWLELLVGNHEIESLTSTTNSPLETVWVLLC